MAVLMIYSLLLICSVSPLLYATSHGGVCSEGSYCPARVDCSSNSSLCQAGVCNTTTGDSCIREVSLSFGSSSYEFDENIGAAQLELTLDGPIECCSISVTVKVEDITAKGGEDYEIPDKRYKIVKFAAGQTRASFDVNIIDDKEMEETETFRVSIFELSVPYGVTLGLDISTEVTITDNDSTTLSFSEETFYVKENEGPAQPELVLSVPAPFNITVQINSLNKDLSENCDQFSATSYEVVFPNGTTRQNFSINITNDDIYEGDESFTLEIQDNLPNLVTRGERHTATVVIQEDEDLIIARFDKNVYRVQEHQGIVTPEIQLSKPSPCCFILHAQLMNITAHGRTIDYGYIPPKIYNYTFHAGSTCASPDADITITDDMESEQEEAFKISIIEYTLPFGVKALGPATIIINDNDNSASFEYDRYNVSEDEGRRYIRIILEEPATSDRVISVYTYNRSAIGGVDYVPGIYNVTFRKGDKDRFFYVSIIDDDIYEGEEEFIVSLEELPLGVVPAFPSQATIKIEDDEYEICFKSRYYKVEEGDNVQLTLTLSRPLLTSVTVRLQYFDITAKKNIDYYASPTSVTFRPGTTTTSVTIRTRGDSVLEQKEESFDVIVEYDLKPNGTFCDEVSITIEDDDDNTIKFDRSEYRSSESSTSPRPRLVLSKQTAQTFRVIIEEVPCPVASTPANNCPSTPAKGEEDYKILPYDVKFVNGGSKYAEFRTEFINDDIVEDDECYCLRIVPDTLPDRLVAINPNFTKICILNDDRCVVTRVGNLLKFSKKLAFDVEVKIIYYDGNPTVVTETLKAGDTEIISNPLRINRLQRIDIHPHCCLDSNDFSISASRTRLRFDHC